MSSSVRHQQQPPSCSVYAAVHSCKSDNVLLLLAAVLDALADVLSYISCPRCARAEGDESNAMPSLQSSDHGLWLCSFLGAVCDLSQLLNTAFNDLLSAVQLSGPLSVLSSCPPSCFYSEVMSSSLPTRMLMTSAAPHP